MLQCAQHPDFVLICSPYFGLPCCAWGKVSQAALLPESVPPSSTDFCRFPRCNGHQRSSNGQCQTGKAMQSACAGIVDMASMLFPSELLAKKTSFWQSSVPWSNSTSRFKTKQQRTGTTLGHYTKITQSISLVSLLLLSAEKSLLTFNVSSFIFTLWISSVVPTEIHDIWPSAWSLSIHIYPHQATASCFWSSSAAFLALESSVLNLGSEKKDPLPILTAWRFTVMKVHPLGISLHLHIYIILYTYSQLFCHVFIIPDQHVSTKINFTKLLQPRGWRQLLVLLQLPPPWSHLIGSQNAETNETHEIRKILEAQSKTELHFGTSVRLTVLTFISVITMV